MGKFASGALADSIHDVSVGSLVFRCDIAGIMEDSGSEVEERLCPGGEVRVRLFLSRWERKRRALNFRFLPHREALQLQMSFSAIKSSTGSVNEHDPNEMTNS